MNIPNPAEFGSVQQVFGDQYYKPQMQLRLAMQARINPVLLGLALGILAPGQSGSRDVRLIDVKGISRGATFTPLASETSVVPVSSFDLNQTDISIGTAGLAFGETFDARVFSNPNWSPNMERIIAETPETWLGFLLSKMCTVLSTTSDIVGTTGTVLTYADFVAAAFKFNDTDGAPAANKAEDGFTPNIFGILDPKQLKELGVDIQGLAAFNGVPQLFQQFTDIRGETPIKFGGALLYGSKRVKTVGSDFIGGLYQKGALVYATVDPSGLASLPGEGKPVFTLPEYGLVNHLVTDALTGKVMMVARAYLGVSQLHSDLAVVVGLRSKVA